MAARVPLRGATFVATVLLASRLLAAAPPLDKPVEVVAREASLAQVAASLAEQTGAAIRVHANAASIKVSLDLHGVALRLALQVLSEVAALSVGQVGDEIVLRRQNDRIEGEKPLDLVARPLRRDEVKKVRYECRNLLPSQLAAYFGRPAVHKTGRGGGLEHAGAVPYVVGHTSLARLDNRPADELAHWGRLQGLVGERLRKRWDDLGTGKTEHPGCRGAIAVPAGVAAVIGFDPTKALIAVGQPAAADRFLRMAIELDHAAAKVEVRARYFVVPVAKLDKVGVKWMTQPTEAGNVRMRYAVGTIDTLSAELAAAAVKDVYDGQALQVDNARPAVLSFTRRLASAAGDLEGCFVTPLMARDATSVLVTSDLKVVPWLIDTSSPRRLALHVEPTFGDVLVDLKEGAGGQASKATSVPCACATFNLPLGQTLVMAGVQPSASFRAVDACRLLSHLPLMGEVYRLPDGPTPDVVVVVAVTARPL